MGPGAVPTRSIHIFFGTCFANEHRRGAVSLTYQCLPAGSSSGAATASRPAAMAAVAYARRSAGRALCSRLVTSACTLPGRKGVQACSSLCRRPSTISRALRHSSTCQATFRAASRPGVNPGSLLRRPSSRGHPCMDLGRQAVRAMEHGRVHHSSSKVCRVVL